MSSNVENTIFTPIRGTESEIFASNNKIEGGVYFAYDTKRIFYGHKNNNNVELIPMGGNSGIYYGLQENLDESNDNPFFFDLQHLDHSESSGLLKLNKGDLILNIPNGIFYKVIGIQISEDDIRYSTERLTVAGSGGGGGQGGGTAISGTLTAYNIDGWTGKYLLTGSKIEIPFTFSAQYNTGDPFDGNVTISVIRPGGTGYQINNVIRVEGVNTLSKIYKYNGQKTMTVNLDVSDLFPPLNRAVTTLEDITIEVAANFGDANTITKNRTITVSIVSVATEWSSMTDNNIIIYDHNNRDFETNYNFYGSGVQYYTSLYLNSEWVASSDILTASSINPQGQFIINQEDFNEFNTGFYSAELRFYAKSTNSEEFSQVGSHKGFLILYSTSEEASVILGTSFDLTTVKQYDNISIPVFLYYTGKGALPALSFSTPTGTITKTDWTNQTWMKFNYSFQEAGEQEFSFICGNSSLIISIMVSEEQIGLLGTEVANYGFKFLPNSFIDNSQILNWTYDDLGETTGFSFSESFDWINGGLQSHISDEDDSLYFSFKIKAGNKITIPLSLFSQTTKNNYIRDYINKNSINGDAGSSGRSFKLVFETSNCSNVDEPFFKWTGSAGNDNSNSIILTPLKGKTLIGGSSADSWWIDNERIEFEINITNTNIEHSYLTTWIDGTPETITSFAGEPNFNNFLTIGSETCDVDIYLMKAYYRTLSPIEHLYNFIADSLYSSLKIDRFQRNNILNQPDDIFSVSIPALLQKNKDCIVHHCIIPQLPQAKLKYKGTGKHGASSGVTTDVKYRQYRDGYTDRPYIQHDDSVLGVQGTSSFNYLLSAANLDIDFKWEHFKDSYGTSIIEDNENIPNISSNGTKYKMSSTSIGENYFNIKVNVASAENVNNALLADLYYKYNPFKSAAVQQDTEDQKENLHRDTIEFTNGLLFISDLNETINDTDNKLNNNLFKEYTQYMNLSASEKENAPQFYAICNFGNSKKNEDIFHRTDELCMEIKTNDNPVVTFEKDYEEVFAAAQRTYEENPETTSAPVGTGNKYMDFANDKSFMIENCFEFRYHPKDNVWEKSVQRVQAEDPESEDGLAWQVDDEGNKTPIYKDNDKTILEQQYEKWDNFVQWMISNNPATATNELLVDDNNEPITKTFSQFAFSQDRSPWLNRLGILISRYAKTYDRDSYEYRMAKMLSECEDHIAMDSLVYHYLFLERFTLIDNVAKNTFWSSNKDSNYTIWDISKDYDNDTGVGINNSGFLKFDYGAECRDNPNIFNGSYHNAWFTFLNGISNDLLEAYKDLDTTIKRKDREEDYSFLKESIKWQNSIPEVCWILDAYRKYQRPYDIYEDSSYLKRLDGGRRKYQRKYYVTYQENYLASKYQIASNIMDLRCRPKSADYGLFIKLRQKGYLNYKLSKSSGAYSSIRVTDPSQYQLIADASAFGADLDENSDGVIFTLTNIDLIEKIGLNDDSVKESFNYQGPGVYEDLLFNDAPFAGCPNISTIVINNTLEENESTRVRYNAITLPVKNSLVKEIYASNLKSDSPIAIDLSTSTSLTFLNLSKSNIYNIQIAKGAPIQTMILPQLTALNLNTLKRLEFISLDSFDSLKTLLINDIDDHKLSFNINNETTKDIYPSQYLFEQIYDQINNDNIFCLQKINWIIDSSSTLSQNITTDSIPFLDILLTKKFRQIDTSDIAIGQNIVPYFSGTITFTDEVYSTGDSINLYNKYILGINQDEEVASLHNLDLKFDSALSQLYNCKVYNGDGNLYWERKYSPTGVISSDFLNTGIISQERIGAFNINDIVKADDPDNTYHFNEGEFAPEQWRIEYNGTEITEIKSLINILTELTTNTTLTTDIKIYPIFTPQTKTYSINIITLDSDNETAIRTETLTRLNIEQPANPPVPIVRNTELESILNAISNIPYLTESNRENYCWVWSGLSYEKNRFADPIVAFNTGGINKNLNLYATFKEVEIGSKESIISKKYFSYNSISSGSTNRILKRNSFYNLGGKIVLPDSDENNNPVTVLSQLNYPDITHIYFSNDFTTTLQTISADTFNDANNLVYFDFKHFASINRIDTLAFYNTNLNADCAQALGAVAVVNFAKQCFYDAFNNTVQTLYIKAGASSNNGIITNCLLDDSAFRCSDITYVSKNKFTNLYISKIDNIFNGNRTSISGPMASQQPFNTITSLNIYSTDLNNITYSNDKIFKENYMTDGVILANLETLKSYLCSSLVSDEKLNIGNINTIS